jgi:hypothetical protein
MLQPNQNTQNDLLGQIEMLNKLMAFKKNYQQPETIQLPSLPQSQRPDAMSMLSQLSDIGVQQATLAEMVKRQEDIGRQVQLEAQKRENMGAFTNELAEISEGLSGKPLTFSTVLRSASKHKISPIDAMDVFKQYTASKENLAKAKKYNEQKPLSTKDQIDAYFFERVINNPEDKEAQRYFKIDTDETDQGNKLSEPQKAKLQSLYNRKAQLQEKIDNGVDSTGRPIDVSLYQKALDQVDYEIDLFENPDPGGDRNPENIGLAINKFVNTFYPEATTEEKQSAVARMYAELPSVSAVNAFSEKTQAEFERKNAVEEERAAAEAKEKAEVEAAEEILKNQAQKDSGVRTIPTQPEVWKGVRQLMEFHDKLKEKRESFYNR